MLYEDRPMNGHNHQKWDLFGILLDMKHQLGGLESSMDMTREDIQSVREEMNEGLTRVHERIDDHLDTPKQEKRGLTHYTGLEPKELIGLIILALAGMAGILTPQHITAWLGH